MRGALRYALFALLALGATACQEGDWLGPAERGMRAAFNGFDMWATDAVRPYEQPLPAAVEGTVPRGPRPSFEAGQTKRDAIPKAERQSQAALAYRRYCHHCHGSSGDGRIIVGESLEEKPTDLRSDNVQSQSEEELYDFLVSGGAVMIPLGATMTSTEMLLAIEHVRTLKNRPSKPYFPPRATEPIE